MQVYDQGGNCDAKQWGYQIRESGGQKSPSKVQGRSTGSGSGGLRPPDAEAFLLILNKILQTLVTFWSHLKLCISDDEFDD